MIPVGSSGAIKQELVEALSNISKIDKTTLLDANNLSNVLIVRRMSWAAERRTTRIEDQAYSLLGIFGVNMPLIYGEREKAFIRLQQVIDQNHPDDLSLFAWSFLASKQDIQRPELSSLFATDPSLFRLCSFLERVRDSTIPSPNIVVTNKVVEILLGAAHGQKC
ncbi:hypothetical protein QBC37DRAFT_82724 [Rhypophila decipiens]|uniref:Uncharacterized protein n=1 Tax=Rhypophila decipiens TaxID=261697 RepID=A0AAN6Y2D2_9PEZI|nr:hypothetical protein QBC37DRAFT_82724 [Rhypophila decipiens]